MTEIPITQGQPHLHLAVQAELVKHLAHVALDRIGRQLELEGDLAVGISQACQCCCLLLTRRELSRRYKMILTQQGIQIGKNS